MSTSIVVYYCVKSTSKETMREQQLDNERLNRRDEHEIIATIHDNEMESLRLTTRLNMLRKRRMELLLELQHRINQPVMKKRDCNGESLRYYIGVCFAYRGTFDKERKDLKLARVVGETSKMVKLLYRGEVGKKEGPFILIKRKPENVMILNEDD